MTSSSRQYDRLRVFRGSLTPTYPCNDAGGVVRCQPSMFPDMELQQVPHRVPAPVPEDVDARTALRVPVLGILIDMVPSAETGIIYC